MSTAAKPGLFHQLKQNLFHGEKHVDTDYETAYGHFSTLNDALHKLKANANNYIGSVYSVFLNGNNVSVDFSTLLDEASSPNPYQSLSQEFRSAHNRLNSERQQRISSELTEKVLRPLEDTMKTYQELHQRIAKRNELHANLEYYLNKVHELNKERDERSSKGKSETSKNIEKFERNQQKLNTARNDYTNFTASLIADLTNAWNARLEMLGPMLASFIQTEKTFLEVYATELIHLGRSASPDRLTTLPAEAIQPKLTPADVPRPVIAGDLHSTIPGQPVVTQPQQTEQSITSTPSSAGMQQPDQQRAVSDVTAVPGAVPGAVVGASAYETAPQQQWQQQQWQQQQQQPQQQWSGASGVSSADSRGAIPMADPSIDQGANPSWSAPGGAVEGSIQPVQAGVSSIVLDPTPVQHSIGGITQTFETTGQSLQNQLDSAGKNIQNQLDSTGQNVQNQIDSTRQNVQNQLDSTGQNVQNQLDLTGKNIQNQFESAGQNIENPFDYSAQPQGIQQSNLSNQWSSGASAGTDATLAGAGAGVGAGAGSVSGIDSTNYGTNLSSKLTGEEESKRQRFEEDQKTRIDNAVNAL